MVTAFIVVAILVFLIVTHELGHFIAAKIFGVRVDEFGVGYPPRAFSFGTWGGTQYTLNWIPFGGFVKLFGEDSVVAGKGSFASTAHWKQAIILLAGIVMNALAAWLLLAGALTTGVPRVVDAVDGQPVHLIVSSVVPGSPADAAGIHTGDQILSIVDDAGTGVADLNPTDVSAYIAMHGGKRVTITYVRGVATSTATAVPANAVLPDQAGKPALGVGLAAISTVALPWGQALKEGFINTVSAFEAVGSSLYQLGVGLFAGKPDLQDIVGPVGLVTVVNQASQNGLGQVLALAGFIAVNLAVINLIPIPALDGGRLLIVIIEMITRRRAPQMAVAVLNTLGIALIIILMVTVTYNDIARLLV